MFLLRSVVGKLWLTIIGLVAIILILLGSFLIPYIENYFSQMKNQTESLKKLATHVSTETSEHLGDTTYYQMANEVLGFHEAHLFIVSKELGSLWIDRRNDTETQYRASDFFSNQDFASVFEGQHVDNSKLVKSHTPISPHNQYLAVAVPLLSKDGATIVGATVLYQSIQGLDATQTYVIRMFVIVSIVGFLLTTIFAFFLFYRITRPLLQLKKAANQITMGQYATRVPIVSTDEIGELAQTFNHMGEELEETIKAHSHEKEHLASVLRSMTDSVITFNADGNIILTNPQGFKIVREWGSIHWDAQLQSQKEQDSLVEDQVEYIPEPLQPLFDYVVANGKETTSKIHVQNGVWSIVMTPLYAQDGVRGAVAVLRDVTEEFRLDRFRKDFVANVSHELRTPLSMLQGYSEALLDDIAGTPEERREIAQVIHDESLRMGRLVHDLLDLAGMESGHLKMNFREVDLHMLVKRIYRKFSGLAKEKGVTLRYELAESPLVLDYADDDRLDQVLTNLLDNAIRYTPKGAEIIIQGQEMNHEGRDGLMVHIIDQGQGIPASDLPFIFERFYKADKARTRASVGGTGLGLAIVKNIIDAHKGDVLVTSVVGQGTTFAIFFPFMKPINME
ncbi:ATP-binding protein [Paenibacillus sp. N1-5-1-14]|uniref:ATP-binding protein n=1 Tax=Paenibacillus radicibacter TaxID=2972488 RepID=UPI002159971F|nr:ATP-binding protein [Paenibacillus radicibacter]MCR8642331.1 ATP-binding protein [Paenibacillus radicibacter]